MCIYLYVHACYIQYLYLPMLCTPIHTHTGFPGGTVVKNLPANAGDSGDVGLIPGLGRPPREGNGYPLQYPSLENPMNRGAWQAIVHEVAEMTDHMQQQNKSPTHMHEILKIYTVTSRVNASEILVDNSRNSFLMVISFSAPTNNV